MAGSIELLSINRKFKYVVGINPPQSNQNDQPLINSRNGIIIISFVLYGLPSAFFAFEAKSILEYGLSFFATSLAVFFTWLYIVMICQIKNIAPFIENCKRFIEKRESSIVAYRELFAKIELLCELVCIAAIITLFLVTLPFLIYSLVNYFIFDLGVESFVLFFPVKWPFDWKKSPLGYFVAWFSQSVGFAVTELTGIIFLNFVFGSCWIFMFMAKDISKDLAAFTPDAKPNKNRAEWTKRLCDFVQIYSDAKDCVNQFNAIVKYSLFVFIFFLMLSVSSILLALQFQLLDNNAKLFETFVVLILAVWVFGDLFFICELGELMTYHFDMSYKELVRCDWYNLPIGMQRMYVIFLSDTQQLKTIRCYGGISCTRNTFKKIINKGFSYFIALRNLEA